MDILAQFKHHDNDDATWTFYTCGKFISSLWPKREDGTNDYSFWNIIIDNNGVKRLMYRHIGDVVWDTDHESFDNSNPSTEDLHIIENIEFAIEMRKMLGDKHE